MKNSWKNSWGVWRTPTELARSTPAFLSAHEVKRAAEVAEKWLRDQEARQELEEQHKLRVSAEF